MARSRITYHRVPRRKKRARRNPSPAVTLGVIGGVGLVGLVAYYALRGPQVPLFPGAAAPATGTNWLSSLIGGVTSFASSKSDAQKKAEYDAMVKASKAKSDAAGKAAVAALKAPAPAPAVPSPGIFASIASFFSGGSTGPQWVVPTGKSYKVCMENGKEVESGRCGPSSVAGWDGGGSIGTKRRRNLGSLG